jgi:hypothetical protein
MKNMVKVGDVLLKFEPSRALLLTWPISCELWDTTKIHILVNHCTVLSSEATVTSH